MLTKAQLVLLLAVLVGGEGPLSSPKVWWAKYLDDDLYTAGQLSATMVKFAHEGGFQTIVSVMPLDTSYAWGPQEVLLNTSSERQLAKELGVAFHLIRKDDSYWKQYSTVEIFFEMYPDLRGPVLLHCDTSYASTFVGLAHLAKMKEEMANYTGIYDAKDVFYRTAPDMGFSFLEDWVLAEIIEKIVGPVDMYRGYPDVSLNGWYHYYWPMKPVGGHWYLAGQIQTNHLQALSGAGIQSIVNTREGPLTPTRTLSKNEQEAVNLLNINDEGGLYSTLGRQHKYMLKSNRINPFLPNSYINETSPVNHQADNPLEFGDWVGYNAEHERRAIDQLNNDDITDWTPSGWNSEDYSDPNGSWGHASGDVGTDHWSSGDSDDSDDRWEMNETTVTDRSWATAYPGYSDYKTSSMMEYYHTPTGDHVTYDVYRRHRGTWYTAGDSGRNVLVHGRGATEAAVGALLAAGLSHGWNSERARQRAAAMGLQWSHDSEEMTLLEDVLGSHVMTAAAAVTDLPGLCVMITVTAIVNNVIA